MPGATRPRLRRSRGFGQAGCQREVRSHVQRAGHGSGQARVDPDGSVLEVQVRGEDLAGGPPLGPKLVVGGVHLAGGEEGYGGEAEVVAEQPGGTPGRLAVAAAASEAVGERGRGGDPQLQVACGGW